LLSTQRQAPSRSDDRERITRARQTAEALFPQKPAVSKPSVSATPRTDQPARKPRVLPIISSSATDAEAVVGPPLEKTQADAQQHLGKEIGAERQTTPAIPQAHFSRIRNWVKYGMTIAQVANIYQTHVGEIERILGKA
jgi:hypothetical protein